MASKTLKSQRDGETQLERTMLRIRIAQGNARKPKTVYKKYVKRD